MTKHKRLIALDVLRGLTVALMITVNNPGSWKYVYPPLRHASWNGCTPTDLVFPFFLFCVGTAMWFSFKKFKSGLTKDATFKIIKRTIIIFLIGIGLNTFPFIGTDFTQMRIMGVLQRIALAYGAASFIVLGLGLKRSYYAAGILLLGYWGLLHLAGEGALTLEGNLVRSVDLAIFGEKHIYHGYGIPFDPEGLFSTLPAIASVLFGYFMGAITDLETDKHRAVKKLMMWGVVFTGLGLVWSPIFPINKPIWSSSYVLYTSGLASIILGILIYAIDLKNKKGWITPALVFGMNPLFIYVMSGVVARLLYMIKLPMGEEIISLKQWMYSNLFASWAGNLNGSLLFAVSLTALLWLMGDNLYRKKIFIKI